MASEGVFEISSSAETVIEVSVCVESLRNVDLLRQGLYAIRCQIYTALPLEGCASTPYSETLTPTQATNARAALREKSGLPPKDKSTSNDSKSHHLPLTPEDHEVQLHGPRLTVGVPYYVVKDGVKGLKGMIQNPGYNPKPPALKTLGVPKRKNGGSGPGGARANLSYETAWEEIYTFEDNTKGAKSGKEGRGGGGGGGEGDDDNKQGENGDIVEDPLDEDQDALRDDDDDEEEECCPDSRMSSNQTSFPHATVSTTGGGEISASGMDGMCFTSQAVRLMYMDQRVILNDTCLFRLPFQPALHQAHHVYLQVSLVVRFLYTLIYIHICCLCRPIASFAPF